MFDVSSKTQTGILAALAEALEARGGSALTNPISMWLAGGLSLSDNGQPVDPLKLWMQQRRSGNTHGGLLQMALDLLSCPGKLLHLVLFFKYCTNTL